MPVTGDTCPHCAAPHPHHLLRIAADANPTMPPIAAQAASRSLAKKAIKTLISQPAPLAGRPLERRQLTIMFTDLVNSTGLADSMDPEDFRALIEAHRTVAVAPIMRYGGHVARYLGDGMLVLFGYPEAHEDSPDRAVRAGLEVVEATKKMNARWVGEGRGRIAVRVGIHTGIVVVGDVLKADVQEMMAVFGNAPSISLLAFKRFGYCEQRGAERQPRKTCCRRACAARPAATPSLKGMSPAGRDLHRDRSARGWGTPALPAGSSPSSIARASWRRSAGPGRPCARAKASYLQIEGEPGIGKSRLVRAVQGTHRHPTQPLAYHPHLPLRHQHRFFRFFRTVSTAPTR